MESQTQPPAAGSGSSLLKWTYQLGFLVIAAVLGHFAAIYLLGSFAPSKSGSGVERSSRLVIADTELDLGRLYETPSHQHTFHITNQGDKAVTITRIEKDCECLEISPGAGVVLAPAETKPFAIKLRLESPPDKREIAAGIPFRVTFGVAYEVEGRTERAEWTLRCHLVPTIAFRPFMLELGAQSDRQLDFERIIVVTATEEIAEIDCQAPSMWLVRAVRDEKSSSPRRFRLVIEWSGRPKLGTVDDEITLTPVTHNKVRLPAKQMKIKGEVVADVQGHPRAVQLGRQTCGTVVVEAIALRSLTNRKFRVKSASGSSADMAVTRTGDEATPIYSLRVCIVQQKDQEMAATFVIEDQDGTEYPLTVPVRYHGIDAGPKKK